METTVSPRGLVWSGEVRLTVLVPPEWSDAEQDELDASMTRVSSQLADALRRVLSERCAVEPRVV
jgi:hypothetical protein